MTPEALAALKAVAEKVGTISFGDEWVIEHGALSRALHNAAPDLIAAAERVQALEAENTRLWEVIREALDDMDDGRSDFARRVLLAGLESCGT